MKYIACYALHYGAEYLAWSIRSIQDAVDEIHVFYTDRPSYGYGNGVVCPESEQQLKFEANKFLTKPLIWHTGHWNNEGEHKGAFLDMARSVGADLILTVDSDELWVPGNAKKALDFVYSQNNSGRWLISFQNFWRSFKYEVRDCFQPVRITDIRHPQNIDSYLSQGQFAPVYHFGYAQTINVLNYKWTCHGHQDELRKGWFDTRFLAWTPQLIDVVGDLHPTVNKLWIKAYRTSEVVDANIHSLLHDHPYFNRDLII